VVDLQEQMGYFLVVAVKQVVALAVVAKHQVVLYKVQLEHQEEEEDISEVVLDLVEEEVQDL
jgi:hypothetical protein